MIHQEIILGEIFMARIEQSQLKNWLDFTDNIIEGNSSEEDDDENNYPPNYIYVKCPDGDIEKIKDVIIDSFSAAYAYGFGLNYKSKYAKALNISDIEDQEDEDWPSDKIRNYLIEKDIISFSEVSDDLSIFASFKDNLSTMEETDYDAFGIEDEVSFYDGLNEEINPYQRIIDLCPCLTELEGFFEVSSYNTTSMSIVYKMVNHELKQFVLGDW